MKLINFLFFILILTPVSILAISVMLVGVYHMWHHSGSFDILIGRFLMIIGSGGLFLILIFLE